MSNNAITQNIATEKKALEQCIKDLTHDIRHFNDNKDNNMVISANMAMLKAEYTRLAKEATKLYNAMVPPEERFQ
jgi:hypothetical protein